MRLKAIITLANRPVELAFRAMERSLRATGCQLPILAIPYDEKIFTLPAGSQWMEDEQSLAVYQWLRQAGAHPTLRKYACLLKENYLFVDTDVAFLQNPAVALEPYQGFVINCSHWMSPKHILTDEVRPFYESLSTTYQKSLFNTGQFACSHSLYTPETLQVTAARWPHTCIHFPYHEQPGLNVLVHASRTAITSLTLPPYHIASSWAGHYERRAQPYWPDETQKPFLLHWAGRKFTGQYPVDEIFLQHLDTNERAQLLAQGSTRATPVGQKIRNLARSLKQALRENFGPHPN